MMTPLRLRPPEELDPVRGRYVRLMLHAATVGEPETPSAMDAGLALCDVLAGREPRPLPRNFDPTNIADSGGHRRVFYGALVCHAWATAMRLSLSVGIAHAKASLARLTKDARVLWSRLNEPMRTLRLPPEPTAACSVAWRWVASTSLAALVAEIDDFRGDAARRQWPPYESVLADQGRGGSFFLGDAESPEPLWYHELVMLHATATMRAVNSSIFGSVDPDGAGDVVRDAALYHHLETQPDHATGQPWAAHAFLLDPETTPTADLLLLAAGVNGAGGLSAVSRILLADAAVCLSVAD